MLIQWLQGKSFGLNIRNANKNTKCYAQAK